MPPAARPARPVRRADGTRSSGSSSPTGPHGGRRGSLLVVVWQLAGALSPRFPTPVETVQFIVDEFNLRIGGGAWSVWNNELVRNLAISMQRAASSLVIVVAIGLPLGYAMGRWWRVQAFFTDIVTVGLALPAYIWALLGVMWFGFGFRAPVFCARGLGDAGARSSTCSRGRSRSRGSCETCPTPTACRSAGRCGISSCPRCPGALIAGFRLAIIATWGCVVLVEWFGNNEGAGFRARYWYDVNNYNGLMGWGLMVLIVVITIDRGIIERVDRSGPSVAGADHELRLRARRARTDERRHRRPTEEREVDTWRG